MEQKNSKKTENLLISAAILIFWLAIWQLFSTVVAKQLLLPSPVATAKRVAELIVSKDFWLISAASFLRITAGLIAGIIFGLILSYLTIKSKLLERIFAPVLYVIKATPVASFIILTLLWIGRDYVASFIVFLLVLPVVWASVTEGVKTVPKELIEVAQSFGSDEMHLISNVYIPCLKPSINAFLKASVGLAWKSGIAAEVLTVPKMSIGKMLFESKLYLETVDLFAWTLVVILFSVIIEKVAVMLIDRFIR